METRVSQVDIIEPSCAQFSKEILKHDTVFNSNTHFRRRKNRTADTSWKVHFLWWDMVNAKSHYTALHWRCI